MPTPKVVEVSKTVQVKAPICNLGSRNSVNTAYEKGHRVGRPSKFFHQTTPCTGLVRGPVAMNEPCHGSPGLQTTPISSAAAVARVVCWPTAQMATRPATPVSTVTKVVGMSWPLLSYYHHLLWPEVTSGRYSAPAAGQSLSRLEVLTHIHNF